MSAPARHREWRDQVVALSAADTDAEHEAVAQMTMAERLERGIALSRFAVRMREAFRTQQRSA